MAEDTGRRLIERGWRQGSQFKPPLPHLVHFQIDNPIRIPKDSVAEAKRAFDEATSTGKVGRPVAAAVRPVKAKDSWVVTTQDCDLIKPESIEPNVTAIRCFQTEKDRVLEAAASNSSYLFLLDEDLGLVADAREQIQIEKPALLEFEPTEVLGSDERRGRFARWLARRSDRPATPDHIVEAFVSPALDLLRRLRDAEPEALLGLERVQELRFRATGEMPIDVAVLFFTEREEVPALELGLADLIGRIADELDPTRARLASWDILNHGDISVLDYAATDQMYLDHYTLRGDTRVGLGPPPRI